MSIGMGVDVNAMRVADVMAYTAKHLTIMVNSGGAPVSHWMRERESTLLTTHTAHQS